MWIGWNAPMFRLAFDSSERIVAVAVAVSTILWMARIRSSSLRHQAWTVVLGAMLAMPLLSGIVPPVQMPHPVTVLIDEIPKVETASRIETTNTTGTSAESAIPTTSGPSSHVASLPTRSVWPLVIFLIYAAGALGLLFRLVLGWLGMRRLLSSSRTAATPDGAAVLESASVSTPLTCGAVRPRIVLPQSWKEWSTEKLQSVLVHERAHVERADALVAFCAQLNRAIFWFHPLAWWLERKLALLAEQACDDAVVRQFGNSALYAEMLVEIASAVRQRGVRFSWQGIGVDGGGILQSRIHRLLRGNFLQHVSPLRAVVITGFCFTTVIYAAAAHRELLSARLISPAGTPTIATPAVIQVSTSTAQGWVERKGQFRPPDGRAPQIIQDHDYSSIEAIEDLYRQLEGISSASGDSFGRSAVWSEMPDGLFFNGTVGGPVPLQIQNGKVIIGKDVFEQEKVILLFSTFFKTLKVFATPGCRNVRFTSLSTRPYKKRTIIEFGCAGEVLTMGSFSNGPNDEERLYVLDIIKEQESRMFGTFPRHVDRQASVPQVSANTQITSTRGASANPGGQIGSPLVPVPDGPLSPDANLSPNSLNIVRDALTNAADNLLKSANQSDYVQNAIKLLDQALDDTKEATAHIHDDSPAGPSTEVVPGFNAAPPPAPLTNFMLYSSLNSLKFAYDALSRVSAGEFGGYRARINNDILATAKLLVDGIAFYNARHPAGR